MTGTWFKSFHAVAEDPLFEDLLVEGIWHRLMTVADRMYPHAGVIPRSIPDDALLRLVEAGRVLRQGRDLYRMPELDEEHELLSASGKKAAQARWGSDKPRPIEAEGSSRNVGRSQPADPGSTTPQAPDEGSDLPRRPRRQPTVADAAERRSDREADAAEADAARITEMLSNYGRLG